MSVTVIRPDSDRANVIAHTFFPVLSMIGPGSGCEPLKVDVRQAGQAHGSYFGSEVRDRTP